MEMRRERSAGGVVVRRFNGVWQFAAIKPRGKDLWALPKGHVEQHESDEDAALREVREETGLRASLDIHLGEISYTFRVEDGRIGKAVTYFLLQWQSGSPMPQVEEVEEVCWMGLDEGHENLAYPGDRQMLLKAAEILAARIT